MAIKANDMRQELKLAYVDFTYADLVSGSDLAAIQVPAGAVLDSGEVITSEAFNSGTSDVIDVGDSGSQNRYLNDADIRSIGRDALTPTGYQYPQESWISVRWTGVGAVPTAGKARLVVKYWQAGRATSTQG